MEKSKYGLLTVIVAIGLFGAVIASLSLTVLIPSFDDLEPVTIYAHRVSVNESFGVGFGGGHRWMPQRKIVESDAVDANYYYMHALDSVKVHISPEDKIEALINKSGDVDEQRFIWQLSKNDEVILAYRDVVAAESKRKQTLMVYGFAVIAASFLLYIMLRYSRD